MLYWLGENLQDWFGPFRIFRSYLFLLGTGLIVGNILSFVILLRMCGVLPKDRGKDFAVSGEINKGKPTGAGILMIIVFAFVSILVSPHKFEVYFVILSTLTMSILGYLDDKSEVPWGEYRKGALDAIICLFTAIVLYYFIGHNWWLPFTKQIFEVPLYIYLPATTSILWLSINAMNCSDGVDGLAASLATLGYLFIAIFLYIPLGHNVVSEYLLLPHFKNGSLWAIQGFIMVGILFGYIWHNAYPSRILMGDAGSRPLGLLLGILVVVSGNPFLLLISAFIILINGGTGLVKIFLIRFLNMHVLKNIRFPLHDHFRHHYKWSHTQVVLRLVLLQISFSIILGILFLKLR